MMSFTPAELEQFIEKISIAVAEKLATRRRLFDYPETSLATGLSQATLERLVKRGTIKPIRTGRRVLFDLDSVIRQLEAASTAADSTSDDPATYTA